MTKTVDVIIPTYCPGEDFDRLIEMLLGQSVPPKSIIIMNSMDDDVYCPDAAAGAYGDTVRVFNIRRSEFDHGHTRNIGVSHSDADYFVCMTQDAVPCDHDLLRVLMAAMTADAGDEKADAGAAGASSCQQVAMAYARQVPGEDASEIEAITRRFNYPEEDRIKTRQDLDELGIKTFFASNVCCCYDRRVFDRLGGFVDRTDFNEDMMYAAKLIKAGYAIRYCADARVYHSHNYSARQQYQRNKQLAVSQAQHPEFFGGIRSESEGVKLVKSTALQLVRDGKWYKVPELVYISGAKYMGYRAGRRAGKRTEAERS